MFLGAFDFTTSIHTKVKLMGWDDGESEGKGTGSGRGDGVFLPKPMSNILRFLDDWHNQQARMQTKAIH